VADFSALFKQAGAGLYEGTLANSSLPGEAGYRPAIVDTIPGTIGIIRTLLNPNAPKDDWLATEARRVQAAGDDANTTFGIKNPANAAELAVRAGGSLAIGFGGAVKALVKGTAKASAKVAPQTTARIASAGQRFAAANPKVAAAAPKVATAALEVAAPIRVAGKGPKQAAAIAGGAGALSVGVAELVDFNSPNTEYRSLRETITGDKDWLGTSEDGAPVIDWEAYNKSELNLRDSQDMDNVIYAGLTAAGIAFGTRSLLRMHSVDVNTAIEEQRTRIVGKFFQPSTLLSNKQKLTASVADNTLPIRKALNDVVPGMGDSIARRLSTASNIGTSSKLRHFLTTGEVRKPNGTLGRYTPLGRTLENIGKELSLDEYRLLNDGLVSRTVLQDFYRTTNLIVNRTVYDAPITVQDHWRKMRAAQANPKIARFMTEIDRAYKELLEFKRDSGLITDNMFNQLRKKYPNYAELSADVVREIEQPEFSLFSANKMQNLIGRTEIEGASVRGGAAAAPVNTIVDTWASTIRAAELNDIRSTVLNTLASRGSKYVKRVGTAYEQTKKQNRVHTIYENGKPVDFVVKDDYLNNALHMYPRVTLPVLDAWRSFGQSLTTGPVGSILSGTLFAFTKAPVFDMLTSVGTKPKNINLGVINAALEKLSSGRLSIGRLDPTVFVQQYIGAVGYLAEGAEKAIAASLAERLQNGTLRFMPPQAAQALVTTLEKSWRSGVRAQMDRLGATSNTMFGSADLARPAEGLERVAPNFARLQTDFASAELQTSSVGSIRKIMEGSKNAVVKANANILSRIVHSLGEAMHNGNRYMIFAANRYRFAHDPLELAGYVRDMSIDTAKHGLRGGMIGETVGTLTSNTMYANLSIQSLYKIGQIIAQNPGQTALNFAAPLTALIGAYLHANATDPEVYERNMSKTVEQKVSGLTLWGGIEFPIEHIFRPLFAMVMPIVDEVFGLNAGVIDMPSVQSMSHLLQDFLTDEELNTRISGGLSSSIEAISPVPISLDDGPKVVGTGNPLIDMIFASSGVNQQMLRMTGNVSQVENRANIVDPNDPEFNEPLLDAAAVNTVATLFSATGQTLAEVSNAFAGAIGQGASIGDAAKLAGSVYGDKAARGSALVTPTAIDINDHLFGPYELKQGVVDANWNILSDKVKGVEQAQKLFQEFKRGGLSTTNSQAAVALEYDTPTVPLQGRMMVIASMADALMRDDRMQLLGERMKSLTKNSRVIQQGYMTTAGEKNIRLNELNRERRELAALRLEVVREYENLVRDQLRDPNFTWESATR
jgi:hypothetical protein